MCSTATQYDSFLSAAGEPSNQECYLYRDISKTSTIESELLQHALKAQNFLPESATAVCKYIIWVDHVFKFSIIAKMGFKFFSSLPLKSNPLHSKHTTIHLQLNSVENYFPDLHHYH